MYICACFRTSHCTGEAIHTSAPIGHHRATGEAKCKVYQARKQSFPAAERLAYADIKLDLHVSGSGFVLVQQYHSSKLKYFRFKPSLL